MCDREREREREKDRERDRDVKSELESIWTPKSGNIKFANGPEHEERLNFVFKSVRNLVLKNIF